MVVVRHAEPGLAHCDHKGVVEGTVVAGIAGCHTVAGKFEERN